MKKGSIYSFFVVFVVMTQQIYAQTIPSRLDIPSWIRMGMSLAQARGGAPNNKLVQRPDFANEYIYAVGDDLHILTVEPNKGVVGLQYGITYNVKTAIQEFTKVYGNPFLESDTMIIWMDFKNHRNISAIKITIHDNNFNYLNVDYFFSNYFE